jgi:hypothetical protein
MRAQQVITALAPVIVGGCGVRLRADLRIQPGDPAAPVQQGQRHPNSLMTVAPAIQSCATIVRLPRHTADVFVGPSLTDAITAFREFQQIMNRRYQRLLATGRRKITRDDGEQVYMVVIDEYAYYSATIGKKTDREEFAALAPT